MLLFNIVLLASAALGTWLLTGIDKTAGGESKRDHHLTRALRCIVVVFLAAVMLLFSEVPGFGIGGAPALVFCSIGIALVLRSSISEIFAQGFLRMIDPMMHDNRQFDPGKTRRYQDTIAHLIHSGHRDEAIKLCEEFKESGEVDLATLQHTLEYLGVKQDRGVLVRPLAEAARLRTERKFAEAEELLKSLLAKNPADVGAAMMLMRVYAQDLRQPARAHGVLSGLEKQPHSSAGQIEYARRSIPEWSAAPAAAPEPQAPARAETVDELLARGGYGTAVHLLEEQLQTKPGDVLLQLKLAEIYAVHCNNFPRAEKLVAQLERVPNANPELIAMARAKLAEWRLAYAGHG